MDKFKAVCEQLLTTHDGNIHFEKATLIAIEHHAIAQHIINHIESKITKLPPNGRLKFFHLLDLICKRTVEEKIDAYIKLIEPILYRIVALIVPKNIDASSNVKPAQNVLNRWKKCKLFHKHKILNASRYLEGYVSSKPVPKQILPRKRERVQKRPEQRQWSTQEREARKILERERSIQKRKKLEDLLRNENEDSEAQFKEAWEKLDIMESCSTEEFLEAWHKEPIKWLPQLDLPPKPSSIFLWDLDALIGEKYYWYRGNGQQGEQVGERMKLKMFDVIDKHMFFEEIEDYDQPHIDSKSEFDDNRDIKNYDFKNDKLFEGKERKLNQTKLAYRYRHIKSVYHDGLSKILSIEDQQSCKEMLYLANKYSDDWINTALKAVRKAYSSGSKNIIFSSAQLVQTLAKCMLYGFSCDFPIDHIYSYSNAPSKRYCFKQIVQRFGKNNIYYVVDDGVEEKDGHEKCSTEESKPDNWMNIAYWETQLYHIKYFSIKKPSNIISIIEKINSGELQ